MSYTFFMAKEKERNEKKKNSSGVSAAFWIVFALVLLILFLVSRDRILTVLYNTDFFGKVFGSNPEFVVKHKPKEGKGPLAEIEIQEQPFIFETETESEKKESETLENKTVLPESDQQESVINEKSKPEQKKSESKTKEIEKQPAAPVTQIAQMEQHLFFIKIAGDGSVIRKEVVRSINKTDMPLTAAVNALLKGPDLRDLDAGFISLIPAGTRLLGASVANGVATINFSDEFRYNQYGVEGYYGQLMQVVYTATAFGNIDSVQFLIEGEKSDYLGSEGVFIGAPLPRSTFR